MLVYLKAEFVVRYESLNRAVPGKVIRWFLALKKSVLEIQVTRTLFFQY